MNALPSLRRAAIGFAALASALPQPPSALARQGDPFGYVMRMTPEEGPVDPLIEKRSTADFAACQKAARITSDNTKCFVDEFARQDAVLNQAWRATFARFAPEQRKALLSAQRRWIAARDPFCASKADGFKGGTIVPIVEMDCRVEQTVRRTIWLEGLGKAR